MNRTQEQEPENDNSRKSLQSIIDHQQIIMIKLTPLPYKTTLDSLTSWILSLSDPPYTLRKPRIIDISQDFQEGLLIYNDINDRLIDDLFDSIFQLNQIQVNSLEEQRWISVGANHYHHPNSRRRLDPIRFKFMSSGYLDTSVLGLYSSSDLLSREDDQDQEKPKPKPINQSTSTSTSTSKSKAEWNSIIIKQKKIQLKETEQNIKQQKLKEDAIKLIHQRSNRLSQHQKLINSAIKRKHDSDLMTSTSGPSASGSGSGSHQENL
ncbi:uncharacterized protein MELLADRAFT_104484 [Melampsora larici-populina 98AG31]|uniref:Uncharacterized protein n=1 Tax=Melampsora larici-populina (strain 98AG31 / pathotype 3-4-7) TaxID=747676 RepID=F4REV2_MELLP|nr:uncharacterized protein MELLADRAFT_104484 [Melampsora larici-populina 98AG31]EGG09218.1 hypothetical protein MELLADRAFT_104484 [Melampsora larici-populina 98AG31]